MKSLFNGLICASLLLAVSCGKDGGGSSGGSSKGLSYNQYVSGDTKQVMENLRKNWYETSNEGQTGYGEVTLEIKRKVNGSQECSTIDLKIIKIPYCFSKYSSTNSSSDQVISTGTLNLVRDGKKIKDRGNSELNSIFNSEIIYAENMDYSQVRVDVKRGNTITSYIINKNVHSLLNPTDVTRLENNMPVTEYKWATPKQPAYPYY